jgi:cyclic 2,3-diphosphoglycerate synthase
VLVDGEHYPPVIEDALTALRGRGFDLVAAVMLGGGEKLRAGMTLGALPIVFGDSQRAALEDAISQHHPDVVIDCSDAPVINTRTRFLLASVALARGVAYQGADFRFDAPPRARLTRRPTIAVIGTGKRTGKTAVAAALARHATERGIRTIIVAMGRGGPAEPVVVHGAEEPLDADALIRLSEAGAHAASDSYEDAVVARVTTVGARRAGGGLGGAPLHDTVAQAIAVADAEGPDLIILEGSGTAIPPAHADVTLLVVGSASTAGDLVDGLNPYRLLISDLVVVSMGPGPVGPTETLPALESQLSLLARDVPIVQIEFRPTPLGSVRGKRVLVATTAPENVGDMLREHLASVHGAEVVATTHRLADRPGLIEDLAHAEGKYDVLLTELKAAAIDVAATTARRSGAEVVFADNRPEGGGLDAAFDRLIETAQGRA